MVGFMDKLKIVLAVNAAQMFDEVEVVNKADRAVGDTMTYTLTDDATDAIKNWGAETCVITAPKPAKVVKIFAPAKQKRNAKARKYKGSKAAKKMARMHKNRGR